MRKILFLTMIAVMAVSCTACGGSKAKDKKADSEVKTEAETGEEGGLSDLEDNFYSQFEGSEYTECTDAEGKTVAELIEDGYSYTGYAGTDNQYYFTFRDDDYEYSVILDDSATDIMNNKEFETSSDELLEMLKDCVVEKCYSKNHNDYSMFASSEYTEYTDAEGKTVSELIKDGYSYTGYVKINNHYYYNFGYNDCEYNVILEDSAADVMENIDFDTPADEVLEMIKDFKADKCYYRESEDSDMDSSKYETNYPEFEGKTIGELEEDGYMVDTYNIGDDYEFFIDGADGEKYVVTVEHSFSEEEDFNIFMSTKKELQKLLKDYVIKTCFKK